MKVVVLILFVLCTSLGFTQEETKKETKTKEPFGERLVWGGDAWANFGNYTFVNVAPMIGYKLTDDWAVGIAGRYQYIGYRYSNGYKYSTSIYGGGTWTRYKFSEQIFAHAEWEMLNLEVDDYLFNIQGRKWVNMLFVGGGYRSAASSVLSIQITALYDLINSRYSPYRYSYLFGDIPIILRAGILVGF